MSEDKGSIMEIEWNLVNKMTLWHYEDLIDKMLKTLSYNFIQEHYNHNMKEACNYVGKLLGYNPKYEASIKRLTSTFKSLGDAKIKNCTDLIEKIETRESCEDFLKITKIQFRDLISVLNYIFRWVLPLEMCICDS